ncbi:MAG: DNA alkylation repair protein [Lachnospiraceae bacterium]|nr:DNA alkylation repair protein [Lachnospiraceae bacterium]
MNNIRATLEKLAEKDYKKFNKSLIPGEENILGVRIPKLRELAKEITKGDWRQFLLEAKDDTFEEVMVQGIVVATAKMETEERKEKLSWFLPKIKNWSVCDSCCTSCKFMKKDRGYWYEYLKEQLESGEEFKIRFALVCLLAHYVTDEYVEIVLKDCENMKHPGYYAKMAAAWAVSVCCAKYPKKTEQFLMDNQMDDWIQNKSIQKSRESYRVTKEQKERLQKLKRG